jgi:hypothetical protein
VPEKKEGTAQPRTSYLYYTVFPGNGPQVIRDAMARRCNARVQWKEVSKDAVTYNTDQQINFIWKPTNFNFKLYSVIDKVLNDSYDFAPTYLEKQLTINHLENIR